MIFAYFLFSGYKRLVGVEVAYLMKRKGFEMGDLVSSILAIHTSDVVYKELRLPLTSLQVSLKKLADTSPGMSELTAGAILTPYHARQFVRQFRAPNDEQATLIGIIRQQSKQVELLQHSLNSSICAFSGCTLLLCGYLPQKLNPLVKPLLESAKVCSNHFTREILASAFCSGFKIMKSTDSYSYIIKERKVSQRVLRVCGNL